MKGRATVELLMGEEDAVDEVSLGNLSDALGFTETALRQRIAMKAKELRDKCSARDATTYERGYRGNR